MDRLTHFLYLLMRDEVPTGVVANLMEQVRQGSEFNGLDFSAPEVRDLADRYGGFLIHDNDPPTRQMQVVDETEAREHEVVRPSE